MNLDFIGKTVLVTGATRGIGKQIADDLAVLGANLILTGTHPKQIAELNQLAINNNLNKKYYCLDLLNKKSLDDFIENLENYPKIDGLINNAGINRLNYINDIIDTDWDEMLTVNLSAPFKLLKVVSKKMINHQYGRVINIASIFSKISKEKRSAYSASKFGLHGLTVGVSNDLARYNIMINTLSPGFVMTELTQKNLLVTEIEQLAKQVPAQRFAEVKDISNVALFLLSEMNTYLTGQNIIVDGGFTNV
jgi:3-oxoacyl-[acyl-carrier protein] reductase